MSDRDGLIDMTAEIVSSYVANNTLPQSEVPAFIHNVYQALSSVHEPNGAQAPKDLKPAIPIEDSITDEFLICLEDGQKFKSLKRHLRTHYNMSPEDYRAKWGLSKDYPMVAPSYAQTRSALAKQMGLGQKRRAVRKRRK